MRTFFLPFRLLRIATVLAKHDVLAALDVHGLVPAPLRLLRRLGRIGRKPVPGRPGEKLARALRELGPSFTKLGQFLATRADIVGDEMAQDLSELQDRLPPFSWEAARQTLEEELGQPVEELFESFDQTPVSAASIAQVHFAVTRPLSLEEVSEDDENADPDQPREVAVKILRPGIKRAVEHDLNLFYWFAELAERGNPKLKRFKPVEVVELFEETIRLEMDFRMEASAASELAANFADDDSYQVPQVDWERTSQRILTQSRLSGIRLDDKEALLAAGHDTKDVLERTAAIFFKQVFRDGFFHGDQHPGNMFVLADGSIGAVDFGIMGRLDRKHQAFLADMLLATLSQDYKKLAQVQADAGMLPDNQSMDLYAQALRAVCEPIFGQPLSRISFARLLGQLLRLSESFSLPVQPQLVLLQKNMLMAEGVSRKLDPTLNIWLLAEPLIVDWMKETRGPRAQIENTAEQFLRIAERLPATLGHLETLLETTTQGGIKLHPETARQFRSGRGWSRLVPWAALALSAAALLAVLLD
ncbi:2-polyprenylphenol 6-hydroxylase [Rhodovibrionaceae bacterium A322]